MVRKESGYVEKLLLSFHCGTERCFVLFCPVHGSSFKTLVHSHFENLSGLPDTVSDRLTFKHTDAAAVEVNWFRFH